MFDDFTDWYSARTVRRRGEAPRASTLVSTTMRLRSILRTSECKCLEELGALLGDRNAVVQLLDKLYLRKAPGTVRGDVVALRHFGDFALAMGWTRHVAIEKGDAPKNIPQKAIEVYSQRDIDKLLLFAQARRNLRYWVFLATITETGRRVSEVINLRYADFRLDVDPAHFDLPHTKTRQCYVPLSRMLRETVWTTEHIERLRTVGDVRIAEHIAERPFPWHYQTATDKLRRLCEVAEVKYRGYHAFRHTKATQLLAKGVPIQAVSSLLGHANVATTDRLYSHVSALDFTRYID